MSKHQFLDLFTEAVKQRLADYYLQSVPAALVSAAFSLYHQDLPENLPIGEFKDAGRAEILLQEKIVKPVCALGKMTFTKDMYAMFADTFAMIAVDEACTDIDYKKYMRELRKRLTASKTRSQRGNVTTFLEMILEDHPDLTNTEYIYSYLKQLQERVNVRMSMKQSRLAEITEEGMKMGNYLRQRVFGQDHAIDAFEIGRAHV